jgi:dihydrofolate reductase
MRIIAINHMSLDGVIQAPAFDAEDERGGFRHGGWASAVTDPDMGQAMSEHITPSSGWLFGRVSYEDMLANWNQRGGPFKDALNAKRKYVATSAEAYAPAWPNTTVLTGDIPAAVARLKASEPDDLVILGSGVLLHTLVPHGLVDELLLFVHPLVLGSGGRMFGDSDDVTRFELVSQKRSPGGVLIAGYRLRPEPA